MEDQVGYEDPVLLVQGKIQVVVVQQGRLARRLGVVLVEEGIAGEAVERACLRASVRPTRSRRAPRSPS